MGAVGAEYFFKQVSDKMFGANFLFDRDRLADGSFDDVADMANVTAVRYPGGTISEKYFDLRDPDWTTAVDPDTGATVELLPLSEFMDWAGAADLGVGIVIPTSILSVGPPGDKEPRSDAYDIVYDFVSDLLGVENGAMRGSIPSRSGTSIGSVPRRITPNMPGSRTSSLAPPQDAIDDDATTATPDWAEPDIGIQVGQYGKYATEPGWQQNDHIMDSLSDKAASAIDSVIAYYYTRGTFADLESFAYVYATEDGFVVAASALGPDMLMLDLAEWGSIQGAIVHEIDATGDRLGPRPSVDLKTYDLASSSAALDFILGGAGADTLDGGADSDRFDGGDGADLILGHDGNDS